MDSATTSVFIKSKMFLSIIISVAVLAIASGMFSIGMAVGYHKARHSYEWSENYSRMFAGPRSGFMRGIIGDMSGRDYIDAHGTYGIIIRTDGTGLIVNGREGAEKGILIGPQTVIRRFHDDITSADLRVGDPIVIVGVPDGDGRIRAQLIRVLPTPPAQ